MVPARRAWGRGDSRHGRENGGGSRGVVCCRRSRRGVYYAGRKAPCKGRRLDREAGTALRFQAIAGEDDEDRSGGADAPHGRGGYGGDGGAGLRENGFSAARWDQAEPLADKHDELRHVRTVLEDGGVRDCPVRDAQPGPGFGR